MSDMTAVTFGEHWRVDLRDQKFESGFLQQRVERTVIGRSRGRKLDDRAGGHLQSFCRQVLLRLVEQRPAHITTLPVSRTRR
jgi:hypothetical protein